MDEMENTGIGENEQETEEQETRGQNGLQSAGETPAETEPESDEEYGTLTVGNLNTVKLGRQGENGTQEVVIDCSAWLEDLPGCTLMIAAVRPGEKTIYVPTVTVTDGVITWPVLAQDTALAGWGRGEVRATLNEQIKKSAVFRTRIEPSLEGGTTTPTTPPDWAVEIMGDTAAAQEAAEAAAASAASMASITIDGTTLVLP